MRGVVVRAALVLAILAPALVAQEDLPLSDPELLLLDSLLQEIGFLRGEIGF
jgi:hypothetical protein